MNQGSSKIRTVEIYSVLILDVLAVVCSYFLAYFCKFRTFHFEHKKEMYTIVLLLVLLFSVLYTLVVNHSSKFLKRGYLIEFLYVTKYVAALFVSMASILFLTKMAEDYSRLMFGFFIVFSEVLTLVFHLLWKRYMQSYYKDEKNQVKLLVKRPCIFGLILRIVRSPEDTTAYTIYKKFNRTKKHLVVLNLRNHQLSLDDHLFLLVILYLF